MELSFLVPVLWKTKRDVTPERRSQTLPLAFHTEGDYKVVVHIKTLVFQAKLLYELREKS